MTIVSFIISFSFFDNRNSFLKYQTIWINHFITSVRFLQN